MTRLVKLEKEDFVEFTEIAIDSFKEDKELYGYYPPFIDEEKKVLLYINDAHTFKIMFDDTMIGGVIIFEQNKDEFVLGSIFIKPEFQGRKIGQKVLLLAESEFPKAKVWTLDAPYKSYRNHYLYEKLGYKKINEEQPDKDDPFTLYIYQKQHIPENF